MKKQTKRIIRKSLGNNKIKNMEEIFYPIGLKK
jgi:hypothetical protein